MENLNKTEYQKYAGKKVPKPTYVKNIFFAFLVGGIICTIGQFVNNYLTNLGYNEELSGMGTSIFMVFLVNRNLMAYQDVAQLNNLQKVHRFV